jgi:hypothetical protein
VYKVESDDEAGHQVAVLPEDALVSYASLIDLIALHPWSGEQLRGGDSASPMRTHTFGTMASAWLSISSWKISNVSLSYACSGLAESQPRAGLSDFLTVYE